MTNTFYQGCHSKQTFYAQNMNQLRGKNLVTINDDIIKKNYNYLGISCDIH